MKRYRLNQLPDTDSHHVFGGIVPGEFIAAGDMLFKSPGFMSHADQPRHMHDEEEIFVILQGKARVRFDDRVEHLVAGDVVVIEAGENHHLEADEEDPCINLYIECGPKPNPQQLARP